MNIKGLSRINHFYSITKLSIYFLSVISLILAISVSSNLWVTITDQVFLGLLFAHGLQLQHECCHDNMFKVKKLNYFFGFLLGVPMLLSFTHYKLQHLNHHRYVGTEKDQPFLNYEKLSKIPKLILRILNIYRVPYFWVCYFKLIRGQYPPFIRHKVHAKKAFQEYSILNFILISAIAFSLIQHSLLFLKIWFIPWLLFAEVFHFLIELPDHTDCKKSTANIYMNTRSTKSNLFLRYIVNENNYHVEHHLYPKVAFYNLHLVHELNKDKINNFSPSYLNFLKNLSFKYFSSSET